MNPQLGVTNDDYETHPFDIDFMLRTWAVRSSDVIWDPFVCQGFSQRYIESRGYQVYRGTEDIMTLDKAPDSVTLIITNPPYSNKGAVLDKLKSFDVPFVLLVPTIVIQRDYFTDAVESSRRHWTVFLPNKSLVFHIGGKVQPTPAFKSCFIFSCPAAPRMSTSVELGKFENVEFQPIDYRKERQRYGFNTADFSID